MNITRVAAERGHTLHFLDEIRAFAPVFLDTEIDMTKVLAHRAYHRGEGTDYSIVSYLLLCAARTLAEHPQANAAIRGHRRPKLARYGSVNGKVTLDKTLNGQRIVLATVLADLQDATLADVQTHLARFRDGDPAEQSEFAPVRLLHRLPWPLAGLFYRMGVRPLSRRPQTMGTFAVTSLGHRPVDGFYSVGGTTVTFGAGRTTDRPVVRDSEIVVVPTMRLCMTFDHRVIDGAEAADVLTEVRERMESFADQENGPPRAVADPVGATVPSVSTGTVRGAR